MVRFGGRRVSSYFLVTLTMNEFIKYARGGADSTKPDRNRPGWQLNVRLNSSILLADNVDGEARPVRAGCIGELGASLTLSELFNYRIACRLSCYGSHAGVLQLILSFNLTHAHITDTRVISTSLITRCCRRHRENNIACYLPLPLLHL